MLLSVVDTPGQNDPAVMKSHPDRSLGPVTLLVLHQCDLQLVDLLPVRTHSGFTFLLKRYCMSLSSFDLLYPEELLHNIQMHGQI